MPAKTEWLVLLGATIPEATASQRESTAIIISSESSSSDLESLRSPDPLGPVVRDASLESIDFMYLGVRRGLSNIINNSTSNLWSMVKRYGINSVTALKCVCKDLCLSTWEMLFGWYGMVVRFAILTLTSFVVSCYNSLPNIIRACCLTSKQPVPPDIFSFLNRYVYFHGFGSSVGPWYIQAAVKF